MHNNSVDTNNPRPLTPLTLWRALTVTVLCALWSLFSYLAAPQASAHGGVIIDGSLTEEYEWLIAVSPYPVTPGATVITLLIYDLDTYAPVNGLDTALYLTPPGGERTGPFALLADPEQYPGDYSNILDIDREGDWDVTFVVNTESETLELGSTFTVQPGNPNEPRPTAEGAADVAATATVFAQNVANARQITPDAAATAVITDSSTVSIDSAGSLSGAGTLSGTETVMFAQSGSNTESDASAAEPTATTNTENVRTAYRAPGGSNPLAQAFRSNPWLWALVGVLPFALLFLWFLRAPAGEEIKTGSAEEEER